MLKRQPLLVELKKLGLKRRQAEIGMDMSIDRYVNLNSHFTPEEAAKQIAECCGKEKARITPGLI